MKELSIEEKARRYDVALEKAKNYYSPETECNVRIAMENLFPGLAESEDEKIRKWIIGVLEALGQNPKIHIEVSPEMMPSALAYLKKQGENNMGISEATKQKLEDNLHKALEKETPESWNEFLDKQGEQQDVSIQINPPEYINDMGGDGCYLKDVTQKPAEVKMLIYQSLRAIYALCFRSLEQKECVLMVRLLTLLRSTHKN